MGRVALGKEHLPVQLDVLWRVGAIKGAAFGVDHLVAQAAVADSRIEERRCICIQEHPAPLVHEHLHVRDFLLAVVRRLDVAVLEQEEGHPCEEVGHERGRNRRREDAQQRAAHAALQCPPLHRAPPSAAQR